MLRNKELTRRATLCGIKWKVFIIDDPLRIKEIDNQYERLSIRSIDPTRCETLRFTGRHLRKRQTTTSRKILMPRKECKCSSSLRNFSMVVNIDRGMFAYRLYVPVSLILVITILMSNTEHVFQYRHKRSGNDVRQYCGRSLSNAMQNVCGSIYNSRFERSAQEMDVGDYKLSNHLIPYKTIEDAKKMLRFRRQSRGIYEECCIKGCSTEEMRSYCASP